MAVRRQVRGVPLATLALVACGGGDATSRRDRADAGVADAGAEAADATRDGDQSWMWTCAQGDTEVNEDEPGTYLDLTKTAAMQTGAGTSTSIGCFKQAEDGLSSWGGIWLQSWLDPEAPGTGVFWAAGASFVLESPTDDILDLTVIPPLAKEVGDIVGPGDDWVNGEAVPADHGEVGVQVAHISDPAGDTAADQIWFMSGIVGLRLTAEDGVHYGFVELEFIPDDRYVYRAEWKPVRWGYHPDPDAAFTIPP